MPAAELMARLAGMRVHVRPASEAVRQSVRCPPVQAANSLHGETTA